MGGFYDYKRILRRLRKLPKTGAQMYLFRDLRTMRKCNFLPGKNGALLKGA